MGVDRSTPSKTDPPVRPRADLRQVFDGVLWFLETNAPWKDLPARYPSYQTRHSYYQGRVRKRVLYEALAKLARDPEKRGKYDMS